MAKSKLLWDVYARTYDGLLNFYPYQQLVASVIESSEIEGSEKVLDLGCGTGNYLVKASKLTSGDLVGVDMSSGMIRVARNKLGKTAPGRVRLSQNDVVRFLKGEPSEHYDKIICTNVVYALKNRGEFWSEILRVLKPSGRAVIATSISTNSKTLISEQLKHAGLIKSLHPRLLGVFICDTLINVVGASGHFEFPGEEQLRHEVLGAGGVMSTTKPCYSGVDILFSVSRSSNK